MIALIILAVILLVLAAVLFLPVSVHIKLKDGFYVKFKFAGIKVFEIKPEDKTDEEPQEKADTVSDEKAEKVSEFDAKKLFLALKEKYGFLGAVKVIFGFFSDVLTHIKKLLRHIKIKRVVLNVKVVSDNAATTAIEYGAVCGAAYPALAFLNSFAGIKYKSINISSDFNSSEPEFDFSLAVSLRIFFVCIAALGVWKEYKKFIEREENNERK